MGLVVGLVVWGGGVEGEVYFEVFLNRVYVGAISRKVTATFVFKSAMLA